MLYQWEAAVKIHNPDECMFLQDLRKIYKGTRSTCNVTSMYNKWGLRVCRALRTFSRRVITEVRLQTDSLTSRDFTEDGRLSRSFPFGLSTRAGFATGNIESKVRSWTDVRTLCWEYIFFCASVAANQSLRSVEHVLNNERLLTKWWRGSAAFSTVFVSVIIPLFPLPFFATMIRFGNPSSK
jgi:hypothetical protein